ncbi:glycosyltransferase [Schleiferiaceae bacterium]|nr:glycosyltransferase [Schleiferiaceae bacterium]
MNNSLISAMSKEGVVFRKIEKGLSKNQTDIGTYSLVKLVRLLRALALVFYSSNKRYKLITTIAWNSPLAFIDILALYLWKKVFKEVVIISHTNPLNAPIRRKQVFKNTTIIHLCEGLITDWMLAAKNIVIPNYVETRELLHKKEGKNFLWLGNLIESKGVLRAITSFKQISHDDAKLIIAGPEASIKKEIILDLIQDDERIQYIGPVYGKEKDELLLNTNYIFMNSRYKNEALPLVLLEGLSFGCIPIIEEIGCLTKSFFKVCPSYDFAEIDSIDYNKQRLQRDKVLKFSQTFSKEVWLQNYRNILC